MTAFYRSFAAAALLGLSALPLAAQAVKLKAYEIEALLSGNTAVGQWDGEDYRQFYGPDGRTLIARGDDGPQQGQWRVDAGRDEVQSTWPSWPDDGNAWNGWFVMEWDSTFYWVSKSTPPTPFEIEEGQSLEAQ